MLSHCKQVEEVHDPSDKPCYFLPHHPVLKPTSSTTKLRVVFDASARTVGPSLNDTLMIGPVVQCDLFSTILRFRKHRYAFTADISKMYRQIRIDEGQTSLQRIFWRENPTDTLQILELTTVTYGTASAPFLATRTLKQLARDESLRHPIASKVVEEDFYVDDVLSGSDSIAEAIQIRCELTELLSQGGFPIHKWCANDDTIIDTIPETQRERLIAFENSDINQVIKTLGLLWNPKEDNFMFHCDSSSDPFQTPTKRQVLSNIARIFDPLGLVSPVVVMAKTIMQLVWMSKIGWDDVLDGELLQTWLHFRESLPNINSIRIPRYFGSPDVQYYEIHGFADASLHAYGACVYIRMVSAVEVKTTLLCSKSKVSPIKPLTIPKLELCAALLLSRLVPRVVSALKMDIRMIYLWSDSQIVLAWLAKSPALLEIFVRNRTIEINNITVSCCWNYVRSEDNPADVVSRGQLPQFLAQNNLWWQGPSFLRRHDYEVTTPEIIPDSDLPGLKPTVVSALACVSSIDVPFLYAFSSFRKLQRIVGYVLRFANNCRASKAARVTKVNLSIPELRKSMLAIVSLIQRIEFSEEIRSISSGEPCRRLASLSPILMDGMIRVGGRLENSRLPFDAKHQLLLPDKNHVTESLIRALHLEFLHIGPSGLVALFRQRFWIINAKSTIQKVIRRCVTCFRSNPRCCQPMMGRLPAVRVVPAPPFSRTGVDFAGPVFLRVGNRKHTLVKAYISLFICMSTKAIHLELVSDLSTQAFVAALHRFISRRGIVEELHSDNGTNFAGAKSELHELFLMFRDDQANGKISKFCEAREITWRFIPPRSPNFGGLWEAGVKSTKTHLRRVLSNASLNYEEYYTILTQIEAILNSRPLFAHSSDPNEPSVITPGHFLVGRELTAIPEPTLEDIPSGRLSRWQYLQLLREHFWKRWSHEYLHTLQSRSKWAKRSPNVFPGMMVLLKEDNFPPQCWKLGKIPKLYRGFDNVVRVVDVKTSTAEYRRPVSKLAPLPIADNDPEPPSSIIPGGEGSRASERMASKSSTEQQNPSEHVSTRKQNQTASQSRTSEKRRSLR